MKKALLLILFLLLPQIANAERLRVDITQGKFEPIPIALHGFTADTAAKDEVNKKLLEVIGNNLSNTGMFKLIGKQAFLEKLQPGQIKPNFGAWKQIGVNALVTGAVVHAGNAIELEFRLWDVLSGQQIAGTSFSTRPNGLRRVAHQISDQIYSRLTGEDGYFDSRIVYVAESGRKISRVKRLAVMDQDGFNHQYITSGGSLVLTPRFTPEDQSIIYLSYADGPPKVHLLEIETGRERQIGNFPGMTFAPRYNKRGDQLLMSVASGGTTEIFSLNTRNKTKRQLTNSSSSISTSPFYSPDESQIVFSSDRGGSQQLYLMDANGNNVKRITFGNGNYSTPAWSPRGDYIAFTKQANGQFYIGVIRPDGSGERLLTSSYLDEGPAWSPNGRVIVFTRQSRSGRSKLHSIDITGYNERVIPTPGDASDPTWSPLLN